jgi:hypothetical protein
MLMKILLTAAVILGAILILRRRVHRVAQVQVAAQTGRQPEIAKSRIQYVAAYGLLLVMLVGAGFFIYLEWQDSYQVVGVRVIDSRTGNTVSYRARRGDIDGRTFLTLDGREITLADVERMELGASSSP